MKKEKHQHAAPASRNPEFNGAFPFTQQDWERTPKAVQDFIINMMHEIVLLRQRIEQLESRLNQNSSNSSRPPSSDSPYSKNPRKKKRRKAGGKKGHRGHQQTMMDPTQTVLVKPEKCSCGNTDFSNAEPYHTHQEIELPEIQMHVTHFILHQGACPCCGKINKAQLPQLQ